MNTRLRVALVVSAVVAFSSLTGAGALPASAVPSTLASQVVEPSGFPDGVTRLSGASRYETAIQVSRQYSPGVPAVYVATGTNFPDALSAAAAAAHVGGPLLLTTPTGLPAAVKTEIKRLNPAKIYVVGGTGAVSNSVATELSSIAPVTRYGGKSRYDTGLSIVNAAFNSASSAVIATGRSFPDALAATGVAGSLNAPVILVDGMQSTVSQATITTLKNLGVKDVIIAGGKGAISSAIETQLRNGGFTVTRYGGADRYSTAALINNAYFPAGSADTIFLATGKNFPDALSGAALAGRLGAPLYITDTTCAPTPIYDSVRVLSPSKRVVLGGSAVVSDFAATNWSCTFGNPLTTSNALLFAESYLKYWSYSRSGLIDQLKFLGFTTAQATYAVDTVSVNWNEQAVKTAKSYLEVGAYSRTSLIALVEAEGFTSAQATSAVDGLPLDWNQQAVKSAESYLQYFAYSRSGLMGLLEFTGFTATQATFGVDNVAVDWNEQAVRRATRYLEDDTYTRAELIDELEWYDKFTTAQATYAADQLGL